MAKAEAKPSVAAAGQESQLPLMSPGRAIMGKLSAASSMFSRKKTDTAETEPVPPPPPARIAATSMTAASAAAVAKTASTRTKNPTKTAVAQSVAPGIKVLPFEVREPSLGAVVVGQLVILEGSCYVWAAAEGSGMQGSLVAAVATRFDGGMPVATPLLAGMGSGGEGGGGGAGAGGGLGVSMAQRLCKRTGRVVFVSCDLPEDSQLLVAAVEGKVVKMLKADEAGSL